MMKFGIAGQGAGLAGEAEGAGPSRVLEARRDGAITWITFTRPDAGNAVNQEVADAFKRAVSISEGDPDCRVVVLQGSGRHFCSGGDIAAIYGAADPAAYLKQLAETVHEALSVLETSRLIVISLVKGAAAGAGLGFVLNSDLVLAGPRSAFLSAYAGIGLSPDCGVSRKLPEIVGPRRAMELALTGRVLTPAEAVDWGLVNEVFDDEDALADRAREIVQSIAAGAGDVMGMTKQLIQSRSSGYNQHLDSEVDALMTMIAQPETASRMAAFMARSQRKASV